MNFSIILCRNNGLGSWFLRTVMWSKWSHSAALDHATGTVYDATMWRGCRKWTATEFYARYPDFVMRPCDIADTNVETARLWLECQLGKTYDWTALLGFVFHRNWQEDDSWFCSEHTETLRTKYGVARFRASAARIIPHHQDIIA